MDSICKSCSWKEIKIHDLQSTIQDLSSHLSNVSDTRLELLNKLELDKNEILVLKHNIDQLTYNNMELIQYKNNNISICDSSNSIINDNNNLKSILLLLNSQFTYLLSTIIDKINILSPINKSPPLIFNSKLDNNLSVDTLTDIITSRDTFLSDIVELLSNSLVTLYNQHQTFKSHISDWSEFHIKFVRRLTTLNYLNSDSEARFKYLRTSQASSLHQSDLFTKLTPKGIKIKSDVDSITAIEVSSVNASLMVSRGVITYYLLAIWRLKLRIKRNKEAIASNINESRLKRSDYAILKTYWIEMKLRFKFKNELYSIHKHLLSSFIDKLHQKRIQKSYNAIVVLFLRRHKSSCLERLNAAFKLSTLDKVLIRRNNEKYLLLIFFKNIRNIYHVRKKSAVDKKLSDSSISCDTLNQKLIDTENKFNTLKCDKELLENYIARLEVTCNETESKLAFTSSTLKEVDDKLQHSVENHDKTLKLLDISTKKNYELGITNNNLISEIDSLSTNKIEISENFKAYTAASNKKCAELLFQLKDSSETFKREIILKDQNFLDLQSSSETIILKLQVELNEVKAKSKETIFSLEQTNIRILNDTKVETELLTKSLNEKTSALVTLKERMVDLEKVSNDSMASLNNQILENQSKYQNRVFLLESQIKENEFKNNSNVTILKVQMQENEHRLNSTIETLKHQINENELKSNLTQTSLKSLQIESEEKYKKNIAILQDNLIESETGFQNKIKELELVLKNNEDSSLLFIKELKKKATEKELELNSKIDSLEAKNINIETKYSEMIIALKEQLHKIEIGSNSKISLLEIALNSSKAEANESKRNLDISKVSNSQLNAKIDELQGKIATLRNESLDYSNELAISRNEVQRLQKDTKEFDAKNKNLNFESLNQKESISQLNLELSNLTDLHNNLSNEMNLTTANYDELQKKFKSLQSSNSVLTGELNKLKEEIKGLYNTRRDLNNEISTLKDDLESYERIEASLVEKNTELTTENANLTNTVSEWQTSFSQAEHNIAHTQSEYESLSSIVVGLQSKLAASEKVISESALKNKKLSLKLKEQTASIDKVNAEYTEISRETEYLHHSKEVTNNKLVNDLEKYKAVNSSLLDSNVSFQNQVTDLNENIRKLNLSLNKVKNQFNESTEEYDALANKYAEMLKAFYDQATDLKNLNNRVETFENEKKINFELPSKATRTSSIVFSSHPKLDSKFSRSEMPIRRLTSFKQSSPLIPDTVNVKEITTLNSLNTTFSSKLSEFSPIPPKRETSVKNQTFINSTPPSVLKTNTTEIKTDLLPASRSRKKSAFVVTHASNTPSISTIDYPTSAKNKVDSARFSISSQSNSNINKIREPSPVLLVKAQSKVPVSTQPPIETLQQSNEEIDNDVDTVVLLDTETNIYHRYPVQYAIDQGWISPSYLNDSQNDIVEEKISDDTISDYHNASDRYIDDNSYIKRSKSLIKKALSAASSHVEEMGNNIDNLNSSELEEETEDTVVLLDSETNTYHRYPISYAVEQGWISPSYLEQNEFNSQELEQQYDFEPPIQKSHAEPQSSKNNTDWTKMSIRQLRNKSNFADEDKYNLDTNSNGSDESLDDEDINYAEYKYPLTPSIVPPLKLANNNSSTSGIEKDSLKMPANSKYGLKGGSKNSDTCSSSSFLEPLNLQDEILSSQPAYSTDNSVGQLFIDIHASPTLHSKNNSLLSLTNVSIDLPQSNFLTTPESRKRADSVAEINKSRRPSGIGKGPEISSPSLLVISPLNESSNNGDKISRMHAVARIRNNSTIAAALPSDISIIDHPQTQSGIVSPLAAPLSARMKPVAVIRKNSELAIALSKSPRNHIPLDYSNVTDKLRMTPTFNSDAESVYDTFSTIQSPEKNNILHTPSHSSIEAVRSPSIISLSNDKSLKLVLNAPSRQSSDPLLSSRTRSDSNHMLLEIPLSVTPTSAEGARKMQPVAIIKKNSSIVSPLSNTETDKNILRIDVNLIPDINSVNSMKSPTVSDGNTSSRKMQPVTIIRKNSSSFLTPTSQNESEKKTFAATNELINLSLSASKSPVSRFPISPMNDGNKSARKMQPIALIRKNSAIPIQSPVSKIEFTKCEASEVDKNLRVRSLSDSILGNQLMSTNKNVNADALTSNIPVETNETIDKKSSIFLTKNSSDPISRNNIIVDSAKTENPALDLPRLFTRQTSNPLPTVFTFKVQDTPSKSFDTLSSAKNINSVSKFDFDKNEPSTPKLSVDVVSANSMRNNKIISPDKNGPASHIDSSFMSNLDVKLLNTNIASVDFQPSSATPRKISYFGTIHAPNEPFVSYRTNTLDFKISSSDKKSALNKSDSPHKTNSLSIPKISPVSFSGENKSKFVCFSPKELFAAQKIQNRSTTPSPSASSIACHAFASPRGILRVKSISPRLGTFSPVFNTDSSLGDISARTKNKVQEVKRSANFNSSSIENSPPYSRREISSNELTDKNKKSVFDNSIELFTTPTYSINKFFPENKVPDFNRSATLDGKYREQYMMRGKQDYLTKTLGYENSAPSTPRIISNIKIENFADTVMEIVTPRRVSIERVAEVAQPVVFYRSSSVDLSRNSSELKSWLENNFDSRRLSHRSLSEVPSGAIDFANLKAKNSPIITSPPATIRKLKTTGDVMSLDALDNKRTIISSRMDNKVLSPAPPRLEKIPEMDVLTSSDSLYLRKNAYTDLVLGPTVNEVLNREIPSSNFGVSSLDSAQSRTLGIISPSNKEFKGMMELGSDLSSADADSIASKIEGVKRELDSEVFGKFPAGASSFFNKIDPNILAKAIKIEENNRSGNQSLSNTPREAQTARLPENDKSEKNKPSLASQLKKTVSMALPRVEKEVKPKRKLSIKQLERKKSMDKSITKNIHSHFAVTVTASKQPALNEIKDKINKSLKSSAAKFETESASTTPRNSDNAARNNSNNSSFSQFKSGLLADVSNSNVLIPESIPSYFKHSTLINQPISSTQEVAINPFTSKPLDKSLNIPDSISSNPIIEDAVSYFKFATTARKISECLDAQSFLDENVVNSIDISAKSKENRHEIKQDIAKMLELEIMLENERKKERELRLEVKKIDDARIEEEMRSSEDKRVQEEKFAEISKAYILKAKMEDDIAHRKKELEVIESHTNEFKVAKSSAIIDSHQHSASLLPPALTEVKAKNLKSPRMEVLSVNRSNSASKRNSFVSPKALISNAESTVTENKDHVSLNLAKSDQNNHVNAIPSFIDKHNHLVDVHPSSNISSPKDYIHLDKGGIFNKQLMEHSNQEQSLKISNKNLKKIQDLYIKLVFDNFFKRSRAILLKGNLYKWILKIKQEKLISKILSNRVSKMKRDFMMKYFKVWRLYTWSEIILKDTKPLMQENYNLNRDLFSIRQLYEKEKSNRRKFDTEHYRKLANNILDFDVKKMFQSNLRI